MAAPEQAPARRAFVVSPNAIRLIVIAAAVCFLFAELVAQNVMHDFGTWQEWIAGGLGLYMLAQLA